MYKKFFISFLTLTIAFIFICTSLVFFVDPFNHYRANQDKTKIIYQLPYYQNIGIAKYAPYDTLITGSSMTQNFNALCFNEKFCCDAIRLSFDGGILSDYCTLLTCATKYNPNLKYIYFGLDNYLITADSSLLNETNRIPDYLSDTNPFNDVKYLLNKDVVFNYTRTYFSYKFSDSYDFYKMHSWDNGTVNFSKDSVLNGYIHPIPQSEKKSDFFIKEAKTLANNIGCIVKNNPNIEFIFFAPPYSILYWNTILVEGKLPATITAIAKVYESLFQFDNVRIFYFQDNKEMIVNLDNYKDPTHYRTSYNEYMLECFATGKNELSSETYRYTLTEMQNWVENYNFDLLFKG